MKKLSLNRISSGNPDIKTKVAYGDFIVVDNYLIIRESITNLLIYKFSGKDSLTYYKEIPLKYKNEIKSIDGINPNNIFVIYHTKEIYVIDIINSTQEKVKININQKISLLEANEISIHDQCELKDSNKSIYIGFVSVNNKQLYLAYKDWNNDNDYILNCVSIKNFKDEIKHIEYKFLNVKKGGNIKTYCFICILCNMEGYTLIVEIKEEFDLNKLISLLKLETNWSLLFSENNILSYNYSFYYNLNSYEQNSILIFTDENKCMIWNFKSDLNNPKDFLIKTELSYKREKGHNKIIDVNHYNKSLFVTTKEELIEYKLLSSLTTSINVFKHTNPTIFKIAIYDVLNLVYILFLTSSDLWYYQIDLNEGHHRKTGSNLSLSGLDNNIEKETESKNSLIPKDNSKIKININPINLDKESNKQQQQNKQRESVMKNSNEQDNRKKCAANDCGKFAKYRCSLCQNFFICEQGMHNNLWEEHRKNCPKLLKKKKMEYDKDKLAPYVPLWNKQRAEIVAHLRKKEFSEAIEKNYILIQENYKLLIQYERESKILPFDDLAVIEMNKKNLLSSFQYYEDYFCNFLLLIHSFSLFKSKDEVWRLLNRLIKEMETYNFMSITNFLIDENKVKVKSDDNQDNYYSNVNIKGEFNQIYLRILKLLVTIAKYGNSLGEFSFYEKFILDYTSKILKAYDEDEYITYNTYLLLGNLYVEYGFLQKGNKLYDAIISDPNNPNNKERLNDVILCANYNSGLINFVIDKYEIAKQRFENALRIKKEFLKEKNDLQISQIYETIAEIDIENKNYASASINLQKAIESRELSNTMDTEFKLRTNELKNYIYQNLGDTKGELNSNVQFRRGENTEDNEINAIILDFAQEEDNKEDNKIDLNQPPDIPELEKFFLFMTKLSISQIDKLNEDQPKDNFEKNKRFPIVFSKNFKNSLTHSQRLALCDLKLTSLTRVNVLKNYTKKISIRNLNYNALNLVPPENNLNSIRNSYVTKTILHNWEARKEEAKKEEELKKVQEEQKSEEEEEEEEENDKIKDNGSFKGDLEDNKSRITRKEEEESDKLEITSEENIDEIEDKTDIDYNGLLLSIKKYCEQNAKEKAKYVDNKFIFLLCREGKMTKEELKRIEKKPELIELLLDTYIEMVKESNEEEKEESQQQKKEESKEYFIQPDTKAVDDGEINKEFFKDDNEYGYGIPIPPPPPPPPVLKIKNIKQKNNKGNK